MASAPAAPTRSGRYLSFAEREALAILRAQGHGVREIARRTAAEEALRLIHVNLESQAGGYPEFVDPCTLAELNIPPQYLKRITTPLYNGCIERYFKQGDSFVIYARARDRERTLYKLSSFGVEKATPEEAQSLGL